MRMAKKLVSMFSLAVAMMTACYAQGAGEKGKPACDPWDCPERWGKTRQQVFQEVNSLQEKLQTKPPAEDERTSPAANAPEAKPPAAKETKPAAEPPKAQATLPPARGAAQPVEQQVPPLEWSDWQEVGTCGRSIGTPITLHVRLTKHDGKSDYGVRTRFANPEAYRASASGTADFLGDDGRGSRKKLAAAGEKTWKVPGQTEVLDPFSTAEQDLGTIFPSAPFQKVPTRIQRIDFQMAVTSYMSPPTRHDGYLSSTDFKDWERCSWTFRPVYREQTKDLPKTLPKAGPGLAPKAASAPPPQAEPRTEWQNLACRFEKTDRRNKNIDGSNTTVEVQTSELAVRNGMMELKRTYEASGYVPGKLFLLIVEGFEVPLRDIASVEDAGDSDAHWIKLNLGKIVSVSRKKRYTNGDESIEMEEYGDSITFCASSAAQKKELLEALRVSVKK